MRRTYRALSILFDVIAGLAGGQDWFDLSGVAINRYPYAPGDEDQITRRRQDFLRTLGIETIAHSGTLVLSPEPGRDAVDLPTASDPGRRSRAA